MPFNDYTEFPRGNVHIAALSDTAKEAFSATQLIKISHIVISGGAVDEVVIFRDLDDSPERMRVAVPAGGTVNVRGFQTDNQGVEVITASAAGDVTVTFYTVEPTRRNVA